MADARMNRSQLIIQEVSRCPAVDGATMADILAFSEPLRLTLKHMVRNGPLPVDQFAEHLEVDLDAARIIATRLLENGYLEKVYADQTDETNETVQAYSPIYRVVLAPLRGRPIPDDL